jgi:hypothetical protein
MGSDAVNKSIQVVVNYWENRPGPDGRPGRGDAKAHVAHRLDELLRKGVHHVATFVPWQAVESDISHSLARFLHAAAERNMGVSLILTPEVGVHFPNSGLPRDVLSRADNTAFHADQSPATAVLPPNVFNLPSFFSPEFSKRYHNFLSRMDNLLASFERAAAEGSGPSMANVTVAVSGSFWKYYRSPRQSAVRPFGGLAGDFSAQGSLGYRKHLEQFYSQREFLGADGHGSAGARWKSPALDEVNRRCFYQLSEEVFRNRTAQNLRKRSLNQPSFTGTGTGAGGRGTMKSLEMELYTPEADPSQSYSSFLQVIAGGNADFSRLSTYIEEASCRSSQAGGEATAPYLHWTSLGGFMSLSDSERQFLVLKSLLLMGSQGGGVLIDEQEWFSFSAAFRARAENFGRSMSQGDLKLKNRALYLTSHLWSRADALWDELFARVGPSARLIASVDRVTRERDAGLVVVDPSLIVTKDMVAKLGAWLKSKGSGHGNRLVVLPRSPLFTEAARQELEALVAGTKKLEIDLGVPYRLYAFGEGKLVVYDAGEDLQGRGGSLERWQHFLTSILSLAEIQAYCRLSDSRLNLIPLERQGKGLGLFILNPTGRSVTADIVFPNEVEVSDLALALNSRASRRTEHGDGARLPAARFALEVPPSGILSLSVDSGALADERARVREIQEAEESAERLRTALAAAANSQLPGLNSGSSMAGTVGWE